MGIQCKAPKNTITCVDMDEVDIIKYQPSTEIRKPQVELRHATVDDAGYIAAAVMSAMGHEPEMPLPETMSSFGDYDKVLSALSDVAAREDTLYSYRNAHIATFGGEVAGVMVGYPGTDYKETARRTFALLAELIGAEPFSPGEETGPGEYYLDSLSVFPEFRGHGIGAILMRNELEVAHGLGFTLAALLVDKEKPWLHKLYASLGFEPDKEVLFFGEPYLRMIQYI